MRKTAPSHIVNAIRNYDPMLRLRWSMERRQFCLERKVPYGLGIPKPVRYVNGGKKMVLAPENSERFIFFHDQYFPILYTSKPDIRLLRELYFGDSYRAGKRAIKEIEEAELDEERRNKQKETSLLADASCESYDRMAWMRGSRMSMNGAH